MEIQWGILSTIQILMCLIVVVVNIPVVVSSSLIVIRGRIEPMATYLVLGNVSLADLLNGMTYLIASVISHIELPSVYCRISMGFILASSMCSIMSVLLLAIERYVFIVHGIHYQSIVTPVRARTSLLAVWIVASIIGLLPTISWNDEGDCWVVTMMPPIAIKAVALLLLLIMLSVLILYILIYSTAVEAAKRLGICLCKTKRKSLMIVYVSACSMIITWMPLLIAVLIAIYFCDLTESNCPSLYFAIRNPLPLVGLINSILNPVLYAWWHQPFKQTVNEVFCCAPNKISPPDNSHTDSNIRIIITGQF